MSRPLSPHAVFTLALAHVPGVGRRRLRRLAERGAGTHVDDADALGAFLASAAPPAGMRVPSPEMCVRAWGEAQRVAATCWRHGWHVWAFGGLDYPSCFEALGDPPALLFVHGASAVPAAPKVAVVGTREPTTWGELTAADCARAVVAAGGVVVSGLAWGIDTAAHEAAVAAHGATWAVLPASLDIIYPESNRRLAADIVARGGALLSEHLPGTRPQPTFFVQRDRLQAALADLVVVVETGRTGGTHHTVRFARELGRPIWVTLPDDVDVGEHAAATPVPEAQQGTWDLWRQGAPRKSANDVGEWVRAAPAEGAQAATSATTPPRLF